MLLQEICTQILMGGQLEDKFCYLGDFDLFKMDNDWSSFKIPKLPNRSSQIKISSKKTRFPKGHFHEVEKKAMALHSFANHELLAIEIMACALLVYPHTTPELKAFKRGVIQSLKDEQKHMKLYLKRLNQLGYEFGDFPINDFFWNQMEKLKTPSQYLAVMSLTFEAANLDFAHFYKHVFKELGDEETSHILDIVLEDEIRHVHLGVTYLNKWRGDKKLWDFYNELLPFPLTPSRAKGKKFIEHVRVKAAMDREFIEKVRRFDDHFAVTKRKEWKQ